MKWHVMLFAMCFGVDIGLGAANTKPAPLMSNYAVKCSNPVLWWNRLGLVRECVFDACALGVSIWGVARHGFTMAMVREKKPESIYGALGITSAVRLLWNLSGIVREPHSFALRPQDVAVVIGGCESSNGFGTQVGLPRMIDTWKARDPYQQTLGLVRSTSCDGLRMREKR